MAEDRSRDDKRSVGSFEKMMGALGNAAGFKSHTYDNGEKFTAKPDGSDHFAPGHGHVTTGTTGYYDPTYIQNTQSLPAEATKGLQH